MVKRIKRLGVPWIIWSVVYWCTIQKMQYPLLRLILRPNYWFLINLLLCEGIVFIASNFSKPYICIGAIYLFLIFSHMQLSGENITIIKNIILYFPFYIFGYCLVNHIKEDRQVIVDRVILFGAILYPVSMCFYSYNDYTVYVDYVKTALGTVGICVENTWIKAGLKFYNHYIVAVLGICFVLWCVDLFEKSNTCIRMKSGLSYLGRVSMHIYIIHIFLYIRYFNSNLLNFIFTFVWGMVIPVVVYKVGQSTRGLDKILFG